MKRYLSLFAILLLGATKLTAANITMSEENISQLVNFLVTSRMQTLGANGTFVPLSFYVGDEEDISAYFGDFLCARDNTCTVVDVIYNNPFAILGRGLTTKESTELEWMSARAQIERTQFKFASDISHAATWQIALALAAKNNFINQSRAKLLIDSQTATLSNPINRAIGPAYRYGRQFIIWNPKLAFTSRWLAQYFNIDPFFGGRFQNFISRDFKLESAARRDPLPRPPSFYSFVTTWDDQKPLTGKNAWAQLIGPLQAEYILNNGRIAANSLALINAMNTLTAFSAMQSGIGAFYFAPEGTKSVQFFISPAEISIEDNFVVLAGLQILNSSLRNTEQTPAVKEALARVRVMLNGGVTINGFTTNGLLSFLYNGAFDAQNGVFFTSGTAFVPSSTRSWRPNPSEIPSFHAVTTNLWALSALGVETIDRWFGPDTSLKLWGIVRTNGGYFKDGELWGVGYSLINGLGGTPQALMTTEGTASAINALYSLLDFYGDRNNSVNLEEDFNSMLRNILHLRNDLYLDANFVAATPPEFFVRLPNERGQAYLYASRQYPIPLDWDANTLPSINANSWVIMNNFIFNPFQYSGKLQGENYPIPERIAILEEEIEFFDGALTKTLPVRFRANSLEPFKKLAIRYNLDGSQTNWIDSLITTEREGTVILPRGTRAISISVVNENVASVCEINPAINLCIDEDCMNAKTIHARWSANGIASCDLSTDAFDERLSIFFRPILRSGDLQ